MKKYFLAITVIALPLFFSGCAKRIVDVTVTIYGTVTDADTGEPLSIAHVSISPGNAGSRDTGSDGYFEFADMQEGFYTITATKVGYKPNLKHVNAAAGSSVQVTLPLQKEKTE